MKTVAYLYWHIFKQILVVDVSNSSTQATKVELPQFRPAWMT